MKPETRNKVLSNFGETVVNLLDQIAELMCQEAAAYYADDRDRQREHAAVLAVHHAKLADVGGPVGKFQVIPKPEKMPILWILIEDFHDLDDVLGRHFDGADGVMADSEASCPFIYCTEAAAPKVIKALEDFYPGVLFEASPVTKGHTVNTVLVNWPAAKAWQDQAR